jgi:signal transduction histidine kinase
LTVAEQSTQVLGFEPTLSFIGPIDSLVSSALIGDVEAVVREAMTNVAKHARANHLQVTVRADADSLSIVVVDNGIGVGDPARTSGLQNLGSRAKKHRGDFAVRAGESGGTELRWTARLSN